MWARTPEYFPQSAVLSGCTPEKNTYYTSYESIITDQLISCYTAMVFAKKKCKEVDETRLFGAAEVYL